MYIYNPRARDAGRRTPSLLQVRCEPPSQQMKVESPRKTAEADLKPPQAQEQSCKHTHVNVYTFMYTY